MRKLHLQSFSFTLHEKSLCCFRVANDYLRTVSEMLHRYTRVLILHLRSGMIHEPEKSKYRMTRSEAEDLGLYFTSSNNSHGSCLISPRLCC